MVVSPEGLASKGSYFWSYVVAWLCIALCLLYSGIIFGWAPLQLLLEEDGVYRSTCGADDPVCSERVSKLVLLYTVGSTGNVIGGAPAGYLVDALGPRYCSILSGAMVSIGMFLLAISDDQSFDAFLPGSCLLGLGGMFITMMSMPVSFVLPESRRTLYLTSLNCLFDASSVVFLLAYQLYKALNVSRQTLFISFAVLCAALHVALFFAWSRGPSQALADVKAAELEDRKVEEAAAAAAAAAAQSSVTDGSGTTNPTQEETDSTDIAPKLSNPNRPPLHGKTVWQQLQTFEFFFAIVFLCFQLYRSNTYLGTNKELLKEMGDADTGYTYTQLFAASLPASTIYTPAISWFIDRYGCVGGYTLILVLGVVYNAVALFDSLPLQFVAFAAFTNFRAFLYSVHFIFLLNTFGSRTSGRVQGVISIFCAVTNFLIWPSTLAASSVDEENKYTYLYGFTLLLSVIPGVLVFLLRRRAWKIKQEQSQRAAVAAPTAKA